MAVRRRLVIANHPITHAISGELVHVGVANQPTLLPFMGVLTDLRVAKLPISHR